MKPELSGHRLVYDANPEVIPSEYPCYFPTLASDGSFVVFQRSKKAGQKDIALWRFDEHKLEVLTDQDGQSMAPSLSFDDMKIAYTAKRDGNWDVYVYSRETKKSTRITTHPARDFAPTFAPDGSLIFASDRTGHFQLYRISAEDMREGHYLEKPFVTGEGDLYAPKVSGDIAPKQSRLGDMLNPPRSSFGVATLGNRIYVVGGHQGHEHTYPPESFLTNLEYYDLGTKGWGTLAPRPRAAHGYGVTAVEKVVGGKVKRYLYAFGGFAYSANHKPKWKSISEIDRYDIDENRWETVGNLLQPRSSNIVAKVGTKVYLIAGWNGTPKFANDADGVFHRSIEVFDTETEKVSLAPFETPLPLRRALSGYVEGDEVILFGGISEGADHFSLIDNVTALNVKTGESRELAKLPFATFAPAAASLNGDLYVFGGMFRLKATPPEKDEFFYVNHIYRLKKRARVWEHTGRYVDGARGFSMVLPVGDGLGILGGHAYFNNTDGPVTTFEIFTP